MQREPILFKDRNEWGEAVEMLCYHCCHFPSCEKLDEMIDAQDQGMTVEGGFVTDQGSGITCLSYKPKGRQALNDQELIELLEQAEGTEMCGGCAARSGTEASNSLHTNRDFKKCVSGRILFSCHESEGNKRPCSGWANAIKKQLVTL